MSFICVFFMSITVGRDGGDDGERGMGREVRREGGVKRMIND